MNYLFNPKNYFIKNKNIFSWALFDFANTAFYVLILTVGYPLYFKEVIAIATNNGDLLWGISFSTSMIIVAIISPILGAVADYGAGKKRFLAIFTATCIIATACLFFVQKNDILLGMLLLVIANIGFESGLVFYDAFLPEISAEKNYGKNSGYGYACGYLGSLVTLLIAIPLYANGFTENNLINVRLSFLMAAGFFLIFSIPLFLFLKDSQRIASLKFNFIKIGFSRLKNTYHNISTYKNIAKFMLAYFLYIDGINTIIIFSSIFAHNTLNFDISEIIIFFALVQTFALLGSVIFGIIADKIGHKKTLSITLVLWIVIVVIAYFVQDKFMFYFVGVLAGLSLGSSQSTSRSLMTTITPQEKKTEFFGFFSFFGKASAILGPIIFGIMSSLFNQRFAILSVAAFIISGLLMLQFVKEKERVTL